MLITLPPLRSMNTLQLYFRTFIMLPVLLIDCLCGIMMVGWHVRDLIAVLTLRILAHNQIKRDLYSELINYWKKAIDIAASKLDQGKIYGQQAVTEWAKE